ncbi:HEAT repeat domain-containing protein [Luteolibacter soli]|uniref:HEAT repeat domain-containing protein n=1 Tax=Luteolibacter soli TaxID=3135280 RepID=A0ABU9AZY0_9BACT
MPRPQLSPYAPGSNEHEAWVHEKADELVKLSWNEDSDSLKRILAELENPEQEIRKAALQAAANFGSRDAIPYLESLVASSTDAEEKIALIQTAEQLKMPAASEYFAQKKAAAAK